jgi:hypothetical protein
VLFGIALLFALYSRHFETRYPRPEDAWIIWGIDIHRPAGILSSTIGFTRRSVPIALAMLAAPWLLGLRIDRSRPERWIPFAVTLAVLMFAPSFANKTAFLHHRFGLYLLPTYCWMFARRAPGEGVFPRAVLAGMALLSSAVLLMHARYAWQFAREAEPLDAAMRTLEPGKRVVNLVFNPWSIAAGYKPVYYHYAAWYQAEEGGLTDFNFAYFHPQVVRFRPEQMPHIGYAKAANKRSTGFMVQAAAALSLWLGAVGAIVWRVVHG